MSRLIRTNTVLDFIQEIMQHSYGNQREAVNQALADRSCMTRYGNNRQYKILRVEWNESPSNTFFNDRAGREMTFREYYESAPYNLRISEEHQPLLVFERRQQKEMVEGRLVPELCSMTGLEDSMRKDFRIMKDLSVHTILPPEQTFDKQDGLVKRINRSNQPLRANWQSPVEILARSGISIDEQATPVQAIQFKPPVITMKGGA